ncbi:MAG: hypothetical protein IJS50_06160 [Desulfovibrio sp.]|nr:hypothetical protein [Desulfovibrio sp.]
MSVDATLAVLYAQTGLGTQFAHAAAVAPHAQAAVTRVIAQETAKQEQQQVEKANQAENKGISKDGRQKKSAGAFSSRRRQRLKEEDKAQNAPSSPYEEPYAGNFLNLTV